jgi:hypothetical protein
MDIEHAVVKVASVESAVCKKFRHRVTGASRHPRSCLTESRACEAKG